MEGGHSLASSGQHPTVVCLPAFAVAIIAQDASEGGLFVALPLAIIAGVCAARAWRRSRRWVGHPAPYPNLSPAIRDLFRGHVDDLSLCQAHDGDDLMRMLSGGPSYLDGLLGPWRACRERIALEGEAPHPDDIRLVRLGCQYLFAQIPAARKSMGSSQVPESWRMGKARELVLRVIGEDYGDATAALSAAHLLLSELEASANCVFDAAHVEDKGYKPGAVKLKNVLRSAALLSVVDERVLLLVHCCIGPLYGCCIRNLVWHGYICPMDASANAAGWYAVLYHLVSAFPTPTPGVRQPGVPPSPSPEGALALPSAAAWLRIAARCTSFISPHMAPAFLDARRLALSGERWRGVALLLCVLEDGLRRAFACSNNLGLDACLAHPFTRHVMLETTMNFTVPPGEEPNRLLEVFGEGPVAALLDEFSFGLSPPTDLPVLPSTLLPLKYPFVVYRNFFVHGTVGGEEAVPPTVVERLGRLTCGVAILSHAKVFAGTDAVAFAKDFLDAGPIVGELEGYVSQRHPAVAVWRLFHDLEEGAGALPFEPGGRAGSRYCSRCSFPHEYCCFGSNPLPCMELRFGASQAASLGLSLSVITQVRTQSLEPGWSEEVVGSAFFLDEGLCRLVARVRRAMGLQSLPDGCTLGPLPPMPRTPASENLSKMNLIKDVLRHVQSTRRQAHEQVLGIAVTVEKEGHVNRTKSARKAARTLGNISVAVRHCELVTLLMWRAFMSGSDFSCVLPMHFFHCSGSVAGCASKGAWSQAVSMIACMLQGGDHGCPPHLIAEHVDRLARGERQRFVFNYAAYLQHVEEGVPLDLRALSQCPMAVTVAEGEMRSDDRAETADARGNGNRWRLHREKARLHRQV